MKKYRIIKEVLRKSWKIGDVYSESEFVNYDIPWMLEVSKCIEEVTLSEVFLPTNTGDGKENSVNFTSSKVSSTKNK